ncbi:hypothetical protein PENOC_003640 [Penicillium occitanis (nom. inval.)]|nr:hypothetical protein PENOC_003640 [Penicillium occitanis (nom. inval.)]
MFLQAFFIASDFCVAHEEPKNIETHNVVIRDDNIYHTKNIVRHFTVVLRRITWIILLISYSHQAKEEARKAIIESHCQLFSVAFHERTNERSKPGGGGLQEHTQARIDLLLLYVEIRRSSKEGNIANLPYARRPYGGLRHRRRCGEKYTAAFGLTGVANNCQMLFEANYHKPCNHIPKDTLHKTMGVADMCCGADDVSNLRQQEKLGTRPIDDISQPYAVRLAEVSQIRKSLSDLRKDYCRKILLEKGVRDCGFEHILVEPEEYLGNTTWSLLWAGSTYVKRE